MKKLILISIVAFAAAGILAVKKTSGGALAARGGDQKETSQVQKRLTPIADLEPASSMTPAPVREQVPAPAHSMRLVGQVKTQGEFRREYANYKSHELKHILNWSREKLRTSGLIEKSNGGTLNDQETFLLITEIRRQGVIGQILTAREVERVKRKFL